MAGDRIGFRTRTAGPLEVTRDGDGYALSLPARKPAPRPLPELVEALGAKAIETLWHGDRYAVVVLAGEPEVLALAPDFAVLAAHGNIQLIVTAPGTSADIVSRVFVPGGGIDEDPVTGSAFCTLAPYWGARLGKQEMRARQVSRRGGEISCALAGDRVHIGGKARLVITGKLTY